MEATTHPKVDKHICYTGAAPSQTNTPQGIFKDLGLNLVPAILSLVACFYACDTSFLARTVIASFGYVVIATPLHKVVKVDGFYAIMDIETPKFDVISENEYGIITDRAIRRTNTSLYTSLQSVFRTITDKNGQLYFRGPLSNAKMAILESLPSVDMQGPSPHGNLPISAYYLVPVLRKLVALFLDFNEYVDPESGFWREKAFGFISSSEMHPIACGTMNTEAISEKVETNGVVGTKLLPGISMETMKMVALSHKTTAFHKSPSFGSFDNAPRFTALLFPYFNGLLIPDRITVISVIQAYFYRYLGADSDEANEMMSSLFNMWASAYFTELGTAFTHLFFGIKLALEMNRHIYVVCEGEEYSGFLLYGTAPVTYGGREYIPVGWETWTQNASHFMSLSWVNRLIMEKLSEVELYTGTLVTLLPEMVSTPWALAMEIFKRDISGLSVEARGKLQSWLNRLPYRGRFLTPTLANVKATLNYIAGGEEPLHYNVNTPFCFYGLLNKPKFDRISLAMGPYGKTAFSLVAHARFTRRKILKVLPDVSDIFGFDEPSKLKHFPLYDVDVAKAVEDMRWVFKEKAIQPMVSKNGKCPGVDHAFEKESAADAFEALEKALNDAKDKYGLIDPKVDKGKRKADEAVVTGNTTFQDRLKKLRVRKDEDEQMEE